MAIPATPTVPPALAEAGQKLRQALLRIDHRARQQVQRLDPTARHAPAVMSYVQDIQTLISCVEWYEQAALANLAPPPVNVGELTPAQLLAYREADPVYRLGWVRGHKAGTAQGQRSVEPAVRRYAQHATLPEPTAPHPTDFEALVRQVRAFLAQLQQRYSTRPLPTTR